MKPYELKSLSPLLFGQGMPFGTTPGALNATSLDAPRPYTIAGAIRTAIGREQNVDFEINSEVETLKSMAVQGPLFIKNGEVLFPAPADALHVTINDKEVDAPSRPDSGATQFVDLPLNAPEDWAPCTTNHLKVELVPSKSKRSPLWGIDRMTKWLTESQPLPVDSNQSYGTPPKEIRTHVGLTDRRAREGMLFTTQGVVISDVINAENERTTIDEWRLAIRAQAPQNLSPVINLGGEGRLATVHTGSDKHWQCPSQIKAALAKTQRVRLVLATPTVFTNGWRPGWDEVHGVGLKLVGACLARKEVWAGWDLQNNRIKPLRNAVRAGSVYFFEVTSGDPTTLAEYWLQSVADLTQDRLDGTGLALWGTW